MSKKMKLSEIKNLVNMGLAEDISYLHFEKANELMQKHNLTTLNISTGVYGMNGALFQDENGKLYAITGRTLTLFQMV